MSQNNYGEIFCQAVSNIIKNEIGHANFDITKNCTIIDVTYRHRKIYKVSDGHITFDAYSENSESYNVGDHVLVTIPQGDYDNQKMIIGLVSSDEDNFLKYNNPLDAMIKATGDIAFSQEGSKYCELIANDPNTTMDCMLEVEKSDRSFHGLTHLGLSADFKALLKNFNLIKGTFGIQIMVYTDDDKVLTLDFSSHDMFGNPYHFTTYFNQNWVFAIPKEYRKINTITAYFYQRGDFEDGNGNLIKPSKNANLFVKDFQLWLGFDSSQVIEEELTITCDTALTYDKDDLQKIIRLKWLHKNSDNTVEILDGTPSVSQDDENRYEYEIRWYQYELGATIPDPDGADSGVAEGTTGSADEYGGPNWKRIHDINEKSFSLNATMDIANVKERFKAVGIITTFPLKNDPSRAIEVNYTSNILNFENVDKETEGGTEYIEIISSKLRLFFTDNSCGNYFLYDQNGFMTNNSAFGSGYERTIRVEYNESGENKAGAWGPVENSSFWNSIKSIKWVYPEESTMIIPGTAPDENNKKPTTFNYRIENNWYPMRRNTNYIKCIIETKKNSHKYILNEMLRFGTKGSSGTNNTFLLEFLEGKNTLFIDNINNDSENSLKIRAVLIDGNGMDVTFSNSESANITWRMWHPHDMLNLPGASVPSGTLKCELNHGDLFPSENKSVIKLSLKNSIENPKVPTDNYMILEASYRYSGDGENAPVLTAFLPIPIGKKHSSYNYFGMTGPVEIIYNHQGTPTYDKGPYGLITSGGGPGAGKFHLTVPLDLTDPDNPKQKNPNLVKLYKQDDRYYLSVPNIYCKNVNSNDAIQDRVCIYYTAGTNEEVRFAQPILLLQSNYDFAMLNNWRGDLTINEENGTILATMIGAGRKNANNTFSGVLVGDIQAGTGKEQTETHTGVYGFGEGVMTYGFRDNGTAFIGATKSGRIEFDGKRSAIYSNGWKYVEPNQWNLASDTKKGTVIDLNDAIFLAKAGEDNYIYFNNKNDGKLEMSLESANIIFKDGNSSQTMQSYINATNEEIAIGASKSIGLACEGTANAYPYDQNAHIIGWYDIDFLKDCNDTTKYGGKTAEQYFRTKPILIPGRGVTVKFVASNSKFWTDSNTVNTMTLKIGIELSGTNRVYTESKPIYYKGKPIAKDNKYVWQDGDTVSFIYDSNAWYIVDSGAYAQIKISADAIISKVDDEIKPLIDGNTEAIKTTNTNIKQTASEITLSSIQSGSLLCLNTAGPGNGEWNARLYSNRLYSTVDEEGNISNVIIDLDWIKTNKIILKVIFKISQNKESFTKDINLKVCTAYDLLHDNDPPIDPADKDAWKGSAPLYYNGSQVGPKNKVPMIAGDYLYIQWDNSFNGWNIVGGGSSAELKIESDSISASVSNKLDASREGEGSSFSWNLTADGFYINNGAKADKDAKFKFNSSGLEVNGKIVATSGKIGGWSISITDDDQCLYFRESGKDPSEGKDGVGVGTSAYSAVGIKPVASNSTKTTIWGGRAYEKSSGNDYTGLPSEWKKYRNENISMYEKFPFPYNCFNLYGTGTLRITKPGSEGVIQFGESVAQTLGEYQVEDYFTDITFSCYKPKSSHVGNLGEPNHHWDVIYVTKQASTSNRNEKTNIATYNIENAYDELKNMPIYTYHYKGTSDVNQNVRAIGTMTDYMPLEAQMADPNNTNSAYNVNNMMFWGIAASKAIQQKLEELTLRVEELEQERSLNNGTN